MTRHNNNYCVHWRVLLVYGLLASCVLCILFVESCVGMFLGSIFFTSTFMLSSVLYHSAKIVCLKYNGDSFCSVVSC